MNHYDEVKNGLLSILSLLLLNFFLYPLIPGDKPYLACGHPFNPISRQNPCKESARYFSIWAELGESFKNYPSSLAVISLVVLLLLGVAGIILWISLPLYRSTLRSLHSSKLQKAALIVLILAGSIGAQVVAAPVYFWVYQQLMMF